ncbi:SDR family NAD(P)-dependent oxidoreductase [Billgrantia endophytica]|nr:SDR family NAD(P)-dependent oxidoreductase [Halomonas endophytica]
MDDVDIVNINQYSTLTMSTWVIEMPTILITGGHKGLGLETTTRVAQLGGFDIVLGGRNHSEVSSVAHDISAKYGANVRTVDLDVSSLASVRAAAGLVQNLVQDGAVAPLQALMLNAGAQFMGPVEYSPDGYEKTFATNCLGHFLLLNLLLEDIRPHGRIVFTASGTHDPDTMDGKMVGKAEEPDAVKLANEGKTGKPLSPGKRYSTSKLCTIMYAYELDRRLRATGSSFRSIAFDPGLIVETSLARTAPPLMQRVARTGFAKRLVKTLGVTMGSLAFSGDALARVAIDPAFARASGKYMQSRNGQLIETRSSAMSYDIERARKLWADSETLVGLPSKAQGA